MSSIFCFQLVASDSNSPIFTRLESKKRIKSEKPRLRGLDLSTSPLKLFAAIKFCAANHVYHIVTILSRAQARSARSGQWVSFSMADNTSGMCTRLGVHVLQAPLLASRRRSGPPALARGRSIKRRIISCAQLGSRTYERTRTNQEVYYQPTGAKTQ
jgi:hypothetical protein